MPRWRDFAPGSVLPSTWTDGMEDALSAMVSSNLRVSRFNTTQIQIVAGAGDDQVSAFIDGKPRWITSTLTAAHPGGGAGTQDIWLTAAADTFGVDGSGNETQTNSMAFGLKIGTPTGSGAEAISRKIGTVTWSGSAITAIEQFVGSPTTFPDGIVIGGGLISTAPTAAVDTTTTQIATTAFVIGQASDAVPTSNSGAGSAGTSKRYSRADHIHPQPQPIETTSTPQFAQMGLGIAANPAVARLLLPAGTTPVDGITFGSGVTNFYRASASVVATDAHFIAGQNLTVTSAFIHQGTQLGFFNGGLNTKKTGYGSGIQIGSNAALTAASTLNDVIGVVSALVEDLRTYGLIGA